MTHVPRWIVGAVVFGVVFGSIRHCQAVTLEFIGTHYEVDDEFPGGDFPYVVVPWHSDTSANVFAISDEVPNRYYGRDGYALFATNFSFPNQNIGYFNTISDPFFTEEESPFQDLLELPDFVADSEILSTHKAAGYEYSLIDDPALQEGIRLWTFDGEDYPPPNEENVTGGTPYVKIGLLTGSDVLGNDPAETPTARWGFEVDENVPQSFRVGVMTDGLDASHFAAAEVFLSHVVDETPVETISTGQLDRNRKVDIHFFDITGAEAGDQFVFSAMRLETDPFAAGISGFTFDVLPVVEAVPGDYNGNGLVDAADYTVWRDTLGQSVTPGTGADGTGPGGSPDGLVDELDYTFWKQQFGSSSGGGSGAVTSAVPEPGTLMLILGVAVSAMLVRRGRLV